MNKISINRSKPVWEKEKNKKRNRKWIIMFFAVLFVFLVINLTIKLPGIYRELNTPFSNIQNKNHLKTNLDKESRVNVLLFTYETNKLKDLVLISHEPKDKKLSSFQTQLPENVKLKNTLTGVFEQKGESGLEIFIESSLGIPIDRYLAIENTDALLDFESIEKVFKQIKSIFIITKIISSKSDLNSIVRSNMTTAELYKVGNAIRAASYEKSSDIVLVDSDQSFINNFETAQTVKNYFFDRSILNEGAAISIEHSSGHEQSAIALANMITNMGAIVVSNDEVEHSDTNIFIKNKKSKFLSRLKSIYNFSQKKAKRDADFAGDILIQLGDNEAKILTLD